MKPKKIAIVANGETPEGEALEALKSAERVIACDGAYARLKSLGIEADFIVGDCDSISEEDRNALGSKLVRVDEQETNDLEKAFRFAVEIAGMLPCQFGRDASTMRPGGGNGRDASTMRPWDAECGRAVGASLSPVQTESIGRDASTMRPGGGNGRDASTMRPWDAECGRAVGASLPDARTPCDISSHPQIVIVGAGGGREDHLIGNVFRLLDFAERVPDVAMVTNSGRFDVVKGERKFKSAPGQAVSVFAPLPGTKLESEGLEWPLGGVDLSRLWSGTLNRTTARGFTIRSTAPVLVYRCGRDASTMRPGGAECGRAVGASLPSQNLLSRKQLPHNRPFAAESLYFISIHAAVRDQNVLAVPDIAPHLWLEWVEYCRIGRCRPLLFLVMPDHVHGLFYFPVSESMQNVVAAWKRITACRYGVRWQRDFFDHRIRNDSECGDKTEYILLNPVRKGLVDSREKWKYFWWGMDLPSGER